MLLSASGDCENRRSDMAVIPASSLMDYYIFVLTWFVTSKNLICPLLPWREGKKKKSLFICVCSAALLCHRCLSSWPLINKLRFVRGRFLGGHIYWGGLYKQETSPGSKDASRPQKERHIISPLLLRWLRPPGKLLSTCCVERNRGCYFFARAAAEYSENNSKNKK